MRSLGLGAVLLVVAACSAPSTPSAELWTPADSTPAPPTPAVADPGQAAARERWAAARPETYAFTYEHLGPSGLAWNWWYRVVTLEGRTEAVHLDGYEAPPDSVSAMTVDALFDRAEASAGSEGTTESTEVRYDPDLGYPLAIEHHDPMVADGDWTDSIQDYRPAPDADPSVAASAIREELSAAREAWRRGEPAAYEYLWTSARGGVPLDAGEVVRVRHEADRTTATRAESHEAVDGAGEASVEATFDAIESAVADGAWVDAVFDRSLGLPLLVAIDPTPAPGDARWTRIRFQDIEAEEAQGAFLEASERWAAVRPTRYSYTWRFRGDEGERWTYRVAMDGDVADIRRSRTAPLVEGTFVAPRIDDLFRLISQVRAAGGRVRVTFDPELGYPARVVLPTTEWSSPGTITVNDMVLDSSS
jgi:hypothetical protein